MIKEHNVHQYIVELENMEFQQILGKVENDRDQLPFISEENNYSKRFYGLFRCKSNVIMNSVQDFFPDFRLISRGGHFC